jgi:uncharacterized protein (DUF427 family)
MSTSMNEKRVLIPSPEHPITIRPSDKHLKVKVAGRVVADTRGALVLKEASYPAVYYVPREDVDITLLSRTDHYTYCPYKGDCSYYSIPIGGEKTVNAVWTYENPHPAVAEVKDYLAFYTDRVDFIVDDAPES